MASSKKSAHTSHPPLSRWKARLRIWNRPTLWISTSILLLTGLLIADYSRVQAGNIEDETTTDTTNTATSDALDNQPATLDGIPLPDDPELREWAIREANDLNPTTDDSDPEVATQNQADNPSSPNEVSQSDASPSITSSEENLLADTSKNNDSSNNESSNSTRQRRNQQSNPSDSVFSNYMDRTDDVLSLMGLKPQPSSNGVTSSPIGDDINSDRSNLFSSPSTNAETLPPSALTQALQNLAESNNSTANNNALPEPPLSSNLNTLPQGIPLQPPIIQTAPPPGTTGYIAPTPLPGTSITAPASSLITPPPIPSSNPGAIGVSGSTASGSVLPPQPNVTIPQSNSSTAPPTPAFVPSAPLDHTPYTGGGRNGRINTFSNP